MCPGSFPWVANTHTNGRLCRGWQESPADPVTLDYPRLRLQSLRLLAGFTTRRFLKNQWFNLPAGDSCHPCDGDSAFVGDLTGGKIIKSIPTLLVTD